MSRSKSKSKNADVACLFYIERYMHKMNGVLQNSGSVARRFFLLSWDDENNSG